MKNILLLTDFSKNSINAINYAIKLIKSDNCHFFVLHVKSSSSYTMDDVMSAGNESIYNSIIKEAKDKLDDLVEKLKKKFGSNNLKFETIVDFDSLTAAITQVVALKQIELIVMGTNGVTGAKEVLFGSNTINVIKNVDCDILVIPENFKYRKVNQIVLPLDPLDSLMGLQFSRILQFVKKYECKISILRINQTGSVPDAQLTDKEIINDFPKEVQYSYNIIENIPMHYAVSGFVQTHKVDLMMLIEQKESLLERFFIDSATTKIGNNLAVPLLVFHK